MKKKTVAIVLVLSMIISLFHGIYISPYNVEASNYQGDCGTYKWIVDSAEGTLVIGPKDDQPIAMNPIPYEWNEYSKYSDLFDTLIIEEGMISVGEYAFQNATNI